MTREYRNKFEAPFNAWVRDNPKLSSAKPPRGAGLSIMDIDFVVHKYRVWESATGEILRRQLMLMVELKTQDGQLPEHQRDTLHVVNQGMLCSDGEYLELRAARSRPAGEYRMYYYGLHLLELSGTAPLDSDSIRWDGREISVEQLEDLLAFVIDPRPGPFGRPIEQRNHHKARQMDLPAHP